MYVTLSHSVWKADVYFDVQRTDQNDERHVFMVKEVVSKVRCHIPSDWVICAVT